MTAAALAERDARRGISRRDFIKLTALSVAPSALAACEGTKVGDIGEPRVIVVGAGLAGLHCAYRLRQVGVDVRVYDAANRVGGRTFTLRGELPDDQIAEMGGEFIDSNHAAMLALAEEFEIALDDRQAEPTGTPETWWIGGAAVPDATIVAQFSAVAERMLTDLEAADEDEDAYTSLDETALSDYLDEVVPSADYPELHSVLTVAYRGEFGRETTEQSALNLVYLIGSDEPDPFRIFGESDERYHAHAGNDAFATALADELGDRVLLGRRLTRLGSLGGRLQLRFELEDGTTDELDADHVVLAIPFSTLRRAEIEDAISAEKRAIIDELGYGTNAKIMGAFTSRIWRVEHDAAGSVTTDLPFQQVWDTSIGQDGEHGILTNFLGGEAGVAAGDVDPEEHYARVASELEAIFPGVEAAYVAGSARRMHWPTAENALGSYTCYLPGQWAFWQLEGEREGNVHFCGEHTSPDFQGWMEGAAETGAFAAAEVLNDLSLAYPPELTALLEEKLPQPTWSLATAPISVVTRRRMLSAQRRKRVRSAR